MKLTSENVTSTFLSCLFKEGESHESLKEAEGVIIRVGFHPERLKKAEPDIIDLLDGLPSEFKKENGGASFLGMNEDRNGDQWTGMHKVMDELVTLGVAIGKISFLIPRKLWAALPGGMPYLAIE